MRIYKIGFIAVFIFSLFFASWYVLHGDITFSSDIARDFHLLRELDEKKIMLIGPRASGNLFHGPGWPYINYPFYVLGQGNPVVVGWGWILLMCFFVASCFFVAKKLFDEKTAYLFGAFAALYMAFHARGMINPHGAMLFVPLFAYTFIKYFETSKTKYLIFHLIIAALIIQIELAIGLPIIILSSLAILYKSIKAQKITNVLYFFLIPLLLVNFLIFDLRHDFLLTHKAIEFVLPKTGGESFDYGEAFRNRIFLMLGGVEILRRDLFTLNYFLLVGTLILAAVQIKERKYPLVYKSLLYFYIGYFVLSFLDKGPILYFYQYPFFPLVFLIFASLVTSRYKKAFLIVFIAVMALNVRSAFLDISDSKGVIGRDVWSWKFHKTLSEKLIAEPEDKFGYFVYSPDALAYEPKYSVSYNLAKSEKNAAYFKKNLVTYIIAAPPPQNNPHMKSDWWIKSQLKINSNPAQIIKFENGYEIRKYILDPDQTGVEFDASIDPGLNFR